MNVRLATRTQRPTCPHGVAGFCWDDATAAEREAVELLHRHAYDWAVGCGIDRDEAERYATDYAREHYGDVDEAPNHRKFHEMWREAN